jgi:hypothetical protein
MSYKLRNNNRGKDRDVISKLIFYYPTPQMGGLLLIRGFLKSPK